MAGVAEVKEKGTMRKKLDSIQDCLFDAFADPSYSNPQDRRQMWAIIEGIRRIDPANTTWRSVDARKDHDCIRGCKIKAGETYFKHIIGAGWGYDWKFCASCVAMILYFMDMERLEPYLYTCWDVEAEKPIRITDTQD